MVNYNRKDSAKDVIADFIDCFKPQNPTTLIIVENGENNTLKEDFNLNQITNILCFEFANSNKAAAINFGIKECIKEDEALIICIDDDIRFHKDFIINYSNAAKEYGDGSYFGTSFYVKKPTNFDNSLIPYMSGSTLGKPDNQFQQMRSPMFLGFSYAFFKSQWKAVDGLDERFSVGSQYGVGGEESVFQKKLKNKGFTPVFIENNRVEHKPLPILFTKYNVVKRQENNGYTHGFQNLVLSTKRFKSDVIKLFISLFVRCFILFFKDDRLKFQMKYAYTKGFFKAFFIYLIIENKNSFLEPQ